MKSTHTPTCSLRPGVALLSVFLLTAISISAQNQPNILWITIEDLSPHLACYGVDNIITPNLDQLASEGVRYDIAWATAPVCAVNRTSILTGIYSTCTGAHQMRNRILYPSEIKTYPELMSQAGYYCTNPAKTDYQFSSPGKEEIWDDAAASAHYRNRPDNNQPFFHVINFATTHQSRHTGDPGGYDPGTLSLPPYYPDTEKVRLQWASYFNNITRVDQQIGEVLAELQNEGAAENTIVFFYSDHGAGLPRAKWWAYDAGLREPFIVRIPEQFRVDGQGKPASATNELISNLDLPSTVLNLAGAEIPSYMQGRAFLGQNLTPEYDYLFGARDRQGERYDIQRAVRNKRYMYIRNYEYWKPVYQYIEYGETKPWNYIMTETRRLYAEGKLNPVQTRLLEVPRPIEELYDLQEDPYEINNLAASPAHQDILLELREAHLKWRRDTRDLGVLPEGILLDERGTYGSEYQLGIQEADRIESLWILLESLHLKTEAELVNMLDDRDPVVRYWSAIGLGNLLEVSAAVKIVLESALSDPSTHVRIAAARGLLLKDENSEALKVLGLAIISKGAAGLAASLVVDEAGYRAKELVPELKTALEGNYSGEVESRIPQVLRRTLETINEPPGYDLNTNDPGKFKL